MKSGHHLENQLALSPTKLPIFHVFCRLLSFSFLKKYVIDNKATHSWTPKKLSHLERGVPKSLLERRDNPEKGGGVAVEKGGLPFFITLQFNCIYCVWDEKVKFGLLHFHSSVF